MIGLSDLRRRLTRLRRARTGARWMTASCRAWAAFLTLLALLMLLDIVLLDRSLRDAAVSRWLISLAALGGLAWCFARLAWPLIRQRESNLQLALSLEHKRGMPGDLVAALQFDRPEAKTWGSARLEQAVIERAARQAAELRLAGEVPWRPAWRSLLWLLAAGVPWAAVMLWMPLHVSVFWSRLRLGAEHYPTRTQIERLEANRQTLIDASTGAASPRVLRVVRGGQVRFIVDCRGMLPRQGRLVTWSPGGGRPRVLPLQPTTLPAEVPAAERARYEGTLRRATDPLLFRLEIGDVRTPALRLEIVPRPLVDISWRVEPPAYARPAFSGASPDPASGQPVLEGSRLTLKVRPLHGKSLQSAWLWIRQRGDRQRIPLERAEADKETWQSPRHPVLNRLAFELEYELQVRDEDGLSLEVPVRGTIGVQPDRPPAAALQTVHRVVLPAATPRMEYRLFDDFGIAGARFLVEIERRGGTAREMPAEARSADPPAASGERAETREAERKTDSELVQVPLPLAGERYPVAASNLPYSGAHPLALAAWKLQRGDRLTITLQVDDHRGDASPRQAASDPVRLEITDEQGLMNAMLETDRQVEKALSEIIARELGIEEQP